MTRLNILLTGVALLLGLSVATHAIGEVTGHQDTDLFTENPNLASSRPNVLFVIDNSSSWSSNLSGVGSTRFEFLITAMDSVIRNLQSDRFNIGIMTGPRMSKEQGAFPLVAIHSINDASRDELLDTINAWKSGTPTKVLANIGANNTGFAGLMMEAYRYFNGKDTLVPQDETQASIEPFTTAAKTKYKGISDEDNPCADNHIIFIANSAGDSNEEKGPSQIYLKNYLSSIGGNTTTITLQRTGRQDNLMDEYARFMAGDNTYTHVIDVYPATSSAALNTSELLKSTAFQGKGGYYAVYNALELEMAILDALGKIQAVESVFAAASLPVSVNTRGTHLNEIYMAMFRPDVDAKLRWTGNIKLYQFDFAQDGGLVMVDKNKKPVHSPATGFLYSDAHSFWTTDSSFWEFRHLEDDEFSESDAPDGENVDKGGAAQQIRNQVDTADGRNLFTCIGNCGSLQEINTSISHTALGVAEADKSAFINWIHGKDNQPQPERGASPSDGKTARPSLHGDVVHSNPVVLNYNRGAEVDSDIVVFYGANDGVLRAVRGGKSTTDAGEELWGFVHESFLSKMDRLRQNTDALNAISIPYPMAGHENNKMSFWDGSLSSYVLDSDTSGVIGDDAGDKAWLFAVPRRGGRFIVAMDVTTPEEPEILWQRGCTDAGVCDTGYGELGQAWSVPVVRRVRYATNAPSAPEGQKFEERVVLFVGAGYDHAKDDYFPADTAQKGRGVLMIDAATGQVLWQAGPAPVGAAINKTVPAMVHSIPAQIVALDSNRDGYADRLYVGDTGGNIWRIEVGPNRQMKDWSVHKFAELGGDSVEDPDLRKFLHAIAVSSAEVNGNYYHSILIGSGDREKPFETQVENYFYMLKDRTPSLSWEGKSALTMDDLYDASANLVQSQDEAVRETALSNLISEEGWYFKLRPGEKTVGRAEVVSGTVFFATNQPAAMADPLSCTSDLGIGRQYVVDYKTAGAMYDWNNDGVIDGDDRSDETGSHVGMPADPIRGIPCVERNDGTVECKEVVCFGPNCVTPPGEALNTRVREYWMREID